MAGVPIRIGIVGFGQIARARHVPVIASDPAFELVAIATPNASEVPDGIPVFDTLSAMLDGVELDAVSLCTPPQVRGELARFAASRGKHVMLEKPPAGTVAEAASLEPHARALGVTMFATWHSMFAAAVAPLRGVLAARPIASIRIAWKEDVEKWHPGATWCWQPGGMGVFDPAINALSIVVAVSPDPVFVTAAEFVVAPDAETPHAARLRLATPGGAFPFSADLDWFHRDDEEWTIACRLLDGGEAVLRQGGQFLEVDGRVVVDGTDREYEGLYGRFAALIRANESEVELRPLQLAADAFMVAGRLDRIARARRQLREKERADGTTSNRHQPAALPVRKVRRGS